MEIKNLAMDRFCKNFERVTRFSVQTRLINENDDKVSMYSVKDLYDGIYKRIGIPIVFDYHHHKFCDGGLSNKKSLMMQSFQHGVISHQLFIIQNLVL